MTNWIQRYILLVLRIGKAVQSRTNDILYDFYGNPQLEMKVAGEDTWSGADLIQETSSLMNDLQLQNFESNRENFLAKQLIALETVCRRLDGERLSLKEEAKRYFNLDVGWIQETVFEEALAIYAQALPGEGSIHERLALYRKRYELPKEKSHLLPTIIQNAVTEAFERTKSIINLPNISKIDIIPFTDKPVKAMAEYKGNYQSRIYINTNIPFNLAELFSIVCHEGFPGHIAEFILKEEHLIKQKGYLEQQVGFLLTPSFVISEGIALLAMESIFASGEAEQWMAENVYRALGIEPDSTDLLGIQRATDLMRGAWCNAALLLDEGNPVSDAVQYIMKHTLCDENQAQRAVQSLQRPYCESYIFTYYYGRKLLEFELSKQQDKEILNKWLTTQIVV